MDGSRTRDPMDRPKESPDRIRLGSPDSRFACLHNPASLFVRLRNQGSDFVRSGLFFASRWTGAEPEISRWTETAPGIRRMDENRTRDQPMGQKRTRNPPMDQRRTRDSVDGRDLNPGSGRWTKAAPGMRQQHGIGSPQQRQHGTSVCSSDGRPIQHRKPAALFGRELDREHRVLRGRFARDAAAVRPHDFLGDR